MDEVTREAFGRLWAASGTTPLSREAAGQIVEAVRVDAGIALTKIREGLTTAEAKNRPGLWVLDATRKAKRDEIAAEKRRQHREAKEASREPPERYRVVNVEALHRGLWITDGRPDEWETCACQACVAGRNGGNE